MPDIGSRMSMANPNHNHKMKDFQSRQNEIAAILLRNRNGGEDWDEMSHLNGKPCSKQQANEFLICCLLDYMQDTDKAWANGHRLVHEILRNPEDVWRAITSVSMDEWNLKKKEYGLHWMRRAHVRLWLIGKRISDEYQGDGRRIWEGQDARSVLRNFWALGAGDQISRMIVGALKDCGLVSGPSDVKGDVMVCRVLGRALEGKEEKDAERAVAMAGKLHPDDPWQLDWPLWHFGETYCHSTSPNCYECPLAPHCAYAAEERSEAEVGGGRSGR